MMDLSTGLIEPVSAPPLSPVDQPLDVTHLARMTLGDASLEREVLRLYDRQAEMLLVRIRIAQPAAVAAHAHTLKGSSSGIGAWKVANAAEALQLTATGETADMQAAISRLAVAVDEARACIAEFLRAH